MGTSHSLNTQGGAAMLSERSNFYVNRNSYKRNSLALSCSSIKKAPFPHDRVVFPGITRPGKDFSPLAFRVSDKVKSKIACPGTALYAGQGMYMRHSSFLA